MSRAREREAHGPGAGRPGGRNPVGKRPRRPGEVAGPHRPVDPGSAQGLAQIVGGVLAGLLIDRLGPRRSLPLALLLQAIAWSMFPLLHHPWEGVALMALDGLGSPATGRRSRCCCPG